MLNSVRNRDNPMATHEDLLRIVKQLPSDFEPFGERNRDTAEPGEDCSCGCIHFVKLAGDLGYDWGVCANAQSPRAGLLTFEHQGCPEFEAESEPEPSDATDAAPESVAAPAAPRKKLKIDFGELQLALEISGASLGIEMRHYLDTETGDIITVCEEWEDYEELSERIDGAAGGRYLHIEQPDSHESFRTMEDFAVSLPESQTKSRLLDALSRNKPFRRFKDIVHRDLALRDQWFQFRDDAMAQDVRDWLDAEGIEAELLRPQP
jgi:uncharacterized protein UPF0158